jgi:hypothetical protein
MHPILKFRTIVRVIIGMVAYTANVEAQGLRTLDDVSYAKAIVEGKTGKSEANYPLLMRLRAHSNAETMRQVNQSPFSFFIETQYSMVAGRVAFATMKFRDEAPPVKEEANARLVSIEVSPGRDFTRADAIENVVLRRGDLAIKPVRQSIVPETIQNRLGARRELTSRSFSFPFEAFLPDVAVSIIFVGRGGNFEWTLTTEELSAIR